MSICAWHDGKTTLDTLYTQSFLFYSVVLDLEYSCKGQRFCGALRQLTARQLENCAGAEFAAILDQRKNCALCSVQCREAGRSFVTIDAFQSFKYELSNTHFQKHCCYCATSVGSAGAVVMADAVTLQLACFMAGMSDSPRKARTAQTCGTADAQQLEHVSGEMMVSMNQQQEITIKTMEETMQKGLKQVSKFPDHLGPMLEGVCGLRAVLPHPERISDPKVREYFRAAHRELGELQEGAVNKVSLLQTQAGTCRGMMMALGTLIQKLHRTCLSESTKMMKYDSEVVRDQIDQIRFFAQEMSKYSEDWTHFKKKCGTSALVEIESLIPAATANATMSSSDEALKKFAKIQSDIRVLIASKFQQMYVLDCSRAALEDVKKSREAEEEALKDLETRQVELEKQKKLLEEARKGESDNFRPGSQNSEAFV